jgi:hypothetical protein
MSRNVRHDGFSLTETLLAVGTLAVGMLFIGGTFMTGVYFTTISTERTIAAVAAQEALAKIRVYGLDPNDPNLASSAFVPYDQVRVIPPVEFLYPSTWDAPASQYSWSAICKRVGGNSRLVQVTVFVCRETGAHMKYWVRKTGAAAPQLDLLDRPHPVRVTIVQKAGQNGDEASIVDAVTTDTIDERTFINDGSSLVDEATGQIYRVLKRPANPADQPDTIKLDRPWTGGPITPPAGGGVWVVPPASGSGRDALVAVYQETVRF